MPEVPRPRHELLGADEVFTWEDPRETYPGLATAEDHTDELTEALNELDVLRMKVAHHQH